MKGGIIMKKYKCSVCGSVYDPQNGDANSAIPLGAAFEDLPEDWTCPICRVGKSSFVELAYAADDEDFGNQKAN